MSAWMNLFVPEKVMLALGEQNFVQPTPIQIESLPAAIRDRRDIVGAAHTGSGKTLAFAIPILNGIMKLKEAAENELNQQLDGEEENEDDEILDEEEPEESAESDGDEEVEEKAEAESSEETKPLYALILTPTRELAIQVKNHIEAAAKYTGITCMAVVGGMSVQKQERLLRRGPEIVVATPGRLWELYSELSNHLSKMPKIRFLVLDEADRMVEKGHFEELEKILGTINSDAENEKRRQTFVFSATLTYTHKAPERLFMQKKKKKLKVTELSIEKKLEVLMGQVGMRERPKIIDLTEKQRTAETLTEARINCSAKERDLYLYYLLQQYPQRTLVFCNSKDCIRRLISIFTLLKCCPLPLHADMQQRQRLKNLDKFKGNPRGLLLATDVAARGLDIPGVEQVVHYQVPRTTESYVHRSGRTARACNEGLSVMMVAPDDLQNYRKIVKSLNRDADLPIFPVESDFVASLKPRVSMAWSIDLEEHKVNKHKRENNWFEKQAKEMDIDLDEDLLNDLGDSYEQARNRDKVYAMRASLDSLLSEPVIRAKQSGKYLTQTGKLYLPYMSSKHATDTVKSMKKVKGSNEEITKKEDKTVKGGKKRKRKEKFVEDE
ncbi:hypothetical protein CAPTEDRAFT_152919 [Capitella teleta]|uniref:RNA helicase n=1 Tax=Capitella teleta TaxID=283909 RepID=R7U820_CAPTE|nr:hypothetical protein CAPTEDRAFT_152919 [Capitella teleta]|eukprot:ELU02510.1 hypothetical protein CAPTEDRAFT_152919 [Capitella teleta]